MHFLCSLCRINGVEAFRCFARPTVKGFRTTKTKLQVCEVLWSTVQNKENMLVKVLAAHQRTRLFTVLQTQQNLVLHSRLAQKLQSNTCSFKIE